MHCRKYLSNFGRYYKYCHHVNFPYLPLCLKRCTVQDSCHNPSAVIGWIRPHWTDNSFELTANTVSRISICRHRTEISASLI